MAPSDKPKVSICLPVYNGARYLVGAIESILAQTYKHFELIICDNASTDETEKICRRYASRFPCQISYYRHRRNLGAAFNFNHGLELASGAYFKWFAHDDVIEPGFLEQCAAALDANPQAILCQSLIRVVDENDRYVGIYDTRLPGLAAREPSRRLAAQWTGSRCLALYGLIRTDVLRRTDLFGTYRCADWALLAELALCGPFIIVPEVLFVSRLAPERYGQIHLWDPQKCLAWWDPDKESRKVLHTWSLYAAYMRMIQRHVSEPAERLRCYGQLLRSLGHRWNAVHLALDPLLVLQPKALVIARDVKRRVFGPAARQAHRLRRLDTSKNH